MEVSKMLTDIRGRAKLSQERLAQVLGVSFVSVNRWERGASTPSPAQMRKIAELHRATHDLWSASKLLAGAPDVFRSRGVRSTSRRQIRTGPTLFDEAPTPVTVTLAQREHPPILHRITDGRYFGCANDATVGRMLDEHQGGARTRNESPANGMSAGKNTYTYDAHTYHTKVPPQGIMELLKHYLPEGGLVLDPFAGSGMTGVASRVLGYDCILNELSPAACFIADRFVSKVDATAFEAAVASILSELRDLRSQLYTTTCRECGRETEILYTVWSYRVLCSACGHEFSLWDHCRSYGKKVREHKILTEFPCPACHAMLKKSRLKRTIAEPVQLGYMCCGSRQQEVTHSLNQADLEVLYWLQLMPPVAAEYVPVLALPEGVNLRQPKHHGLDRVDKLYTSRNLAAMSHIWKQIHRIDDPELTAHVAFVFTSLYQRVTRLSEFRFWGGSGNTARFNVPFIFNEANVFVTFARKARTIQDHLETTTPQYQGKAFVIQGSATSLDYLPDESVDLVFTDPPFGANINYSEMNILWESWLGRYTDTRDEAIMNAVQGKDIADYQRLMTESLRECYRVLRPGHWMLLVFMNSSSTVWAALRAAIADAGFAIRQADIFDKQHGTFKQFVSDNTAGCDLVLHCWKPSVPDMPRWSGRNVTARESVEMFLRDVDLTTRRNVFLHVQRDDELDFRKLYSEWTAHTILEGNEPLDFADFRSIVLEMLCQ